MSRTLPFLTRALAALVLLGSVTAVAACPFVGRFLVVEDQASSADAIVVLAGGRAARWMEAVDLYKEQVAQSIVLSSDRMEGAEFQLLQRGIQLPRHSDLARLAIIQLGVPADRVEVFPAPVDNTAEEALVTRRLAQSRGWHRVLIVTSKYHTRRTRFAFRREFRNTGIEVVVRGTRYDTITPHRWWLYRYDARWVLMEAPKLIAYALGMEG